MSASVTLRPGDTYSLTTGTVTRAPRPTLPVTWSLDHMIGRNDLRALSVFFRNSARR